MEIYYLNDEKYKSTEELIDILNNSGLHDKDLVANARIELAIRGVHLEVKNNELQLEDKKKVSPPSFFLPGSIFSKRWKDNIVKDENAPKLYSKLVIYSFSILFSVMFSGILMAMNFKRVKNEKGIPMVLLFSFFFTLAEITILNLLKANSFLYVITNGIGAIVLYSFFWNRYIGLEQLYRTRTFWVPLLIGMLICVVIILLILSGLQGK